jgi:osmotically-inducible protein OsmY
MKSRTTPASQSGALLAAAGFGAALMYFLDPSRGASRRAVATDKAERLVQSGADEIQRRAVRTRNQINGAVARARARLGHDEPTDVQLAERVRSALGHYTGHAHDIEVVVRHGVVTLQGHIPAEDLSDVLRETRRVPGVRDVHDELSLRAHDPAPAGQSPLG